MSATTTEMTAEIAALRKHKQQIEDGLAMLGSDNPLNVILRLQHDLSEGREQSQAQIYTLSREHDAEVDSLRGEIWTLEEQLSEANGKVIELSLLRDTNAELTQTVDEVKYDARRLEERLSEADSRWLPMHIALGQQNAELSSLRGSLSQAEKSYHLLQATNVELTQTVAKLTEDLSEANGKVIQYHTAWGQQKAELSSLRGSIIQTEKSYHLLQDRLDNESDAVAVLTRTVDSLRRTIQSDFASSEETIRKLTEERDVWKNRHAAVTQSAERLQSQMDEAQKRVAIAMAAIAEPSKTASRTLNPTAPEFVPSKPTQTQTLMEAVQKRMAEMAPTLTVTEVSVPDHETNSDAYKDFCVSTIHGMLDECAAAEISADKVSVAIRLFTFIKDHGMPLMRAHAKFRLTVLAKCWEFKASESSTAELNSLMDWVLDQFKDEHPALSSYDCRACSRCYRYLSSSIVKLAGTQTNNTPTVRLTTPIKRIPVPSAPSAPQKRYRTRTRTGVIRRINYTEESDSE
jgi:hypothetical protein